MTINKRILISSIVPVIQHGRQGLCRLNLTGMVANHLYILLLSEDIVTNYDMSQEQEQCLRIKLVLLKGFHTIIERSTNFSTVRTCCISLVVKRVTRGGLKNKYMCHSLKSVSLPQCNERLFRALDFISKPSLDLLHLDEQTLVC